jgi:hypothetical protein
MELTTGTVVDGKVVVEGRALREGAQVTILVDDEEPKLSPDQSTLLERSLIQSEKGKVVDGWDLLNEIRSSRLGRQTS